MGRLDPTAAADGAQQEFLNKAETEAAGLDRMVACERVLGPFENQMVAIALAIDSPAQDDMPGPLGHRPELNGAD